MICPTARGARWARDVTLARRSQGVEAKVANASPLLVRASAMCAAVVVREAAEGRRGRVGERGGGLQRGRPIRSTNGPAGRVRGQGKHGVEHNNECREKRGRPKKAQYPRPNFKSLWELLEPRRENVGTLHVDGSTAPTASRQPTAPATPTAIEMKLLRHREPRRSWERRVGGTGEIARGASGAHGEARAHGDLGELASLSGQWSALPSTATAFAGADRPARRPLFRTRPAPASRGDALRDLGQALPANAVDGGRLLHGRALSSPDAPFARAARRAGRPLLRTRTAPSAPLPEDSSGLCSGVLQSTE